MMCRKPFIVAACMAAAFVATTASAETKPGIVWIPTSPVDVTPSGAPGTQCAKASMSATAVAAGCLPNLGGEATLTPHPNAQQIVDGVAAAFAAYDLRVVTEPPAEYLPTFGVFTSDEVVGEGTSTSYTCSSTAANCEARARDRGYFTNGGTPFCTDPDIVTSAVFAVGLMSGLEGKAAAPDDWMNYPPEFTAPPTQFLDACGDIANLLGGEDGMTPQPLQCTSLDHVGCDSGQQNSHADLLANLGPVGGDDEAPVITVVSPSDGEAIEEGGPLSVDFTLDEASNFAGARISIRSDALVGLIENDEITFCTSDICDVNWLDNDPFKTADSGWSSGTIKGLPPGEYVIEIEASDYYGNEAETITLTLTIGDGPVDPTAGDTSTGGESTSTGVGDETGADTGSTDPSGTSITGGGTATSSPAETGDPTTGPDTTDPSAGGSSGSDGQTSADDDLGSRGCSTGPRQRSGGGLVLMLGLLGVGLRRRR